MSVLVDEFAGYYRNKSHINTANKTLEQLKNLNTDYDILLQKLENDPNYIQRIAPIVLGRQNEPNDNIVYPGMTPQQLDAARKILDERASQGYSEMIEPDWLARCKDPRKRILLFLSGACLILVSFVFFGAENKPKQ